MKTIDDILARLEQIVLENEQAGNPLGYFPALYYSMTAAVKGGIAQGRFENGPRMEQLDVVFAQRYFEAYDAWKAGKPLSMSWRAAFEGAADRHLSVLQHLLLGMHAHINFDLGIAAAQICPGQAIWGLKNDFEAINTIMSELLNAVQDSLADICPPFRALDAVLRTKDEGFADFSIAVARKTAWNAALALAFLKGKARVAFVDGLDEGVAGFAQRLRSPKGWVLRSALHAIRLSEEGSIPEKIRRLQL